MDHYILPVFTHTFYVVFVLVLNEMVLVLAIESSSISIA